MNVAPTQPATVLVIDDSKLVRQLAATLLHQSGYTVHESAHGEEGLALARRHPPDVILCDIHMPVLDGWGFVAQARQCPVLQTVPILMLTADKDHESARRAMSTGADDYLTKPWKAHDLLQAVRALERKRARQRADTERSLEQLRGAILATVPHELRTPLTSILGLTRLLIDRHDRYPTERRLQMLGEVHGAATRLSRTIARMMTWAELSGQPPPRPGTPLPGVEAAEVAVWVHAPAFTDELHAALQLAVAAPGGPADGRAGHGAVLRIDGHPLNVRMEPGRLQCSAEDLQAMLAELVANALRFSQPGMPVGLTGAPQPGGGYAIEVADIGLAIPAEFLARIGALAQADRDRHEQQGLGLGLAMTHLRARRHRARLSVPRHDGQPTIFRLDFAPPV